MPCPARLRPSGDTAEKKPTKVKGMNNSYCWPLDLYHVMVAYIYIALLVTINYKL